MAAITTRTFRPRSWRECSRLTAFLGLEERVDGLHCRHEFSQKSIAAVTALRKDLLSRTS